MNFPIVGTFLLLAARVAVAQSFYAVTDLGPGRAYAINELGHVAGETEIRNGDRHAFVWTPNGLTDLGTLGGRSSRAFGINAQGWVVGESDTTNGRTAACLWRDGDPVALGDNGTIYAVSDSGALAGVLNETAVLWPSPDATPVTLTAGGAIGIAYDVNAAGRVVGQSEMGDPDGRASRAFAYERGVAAGLVELERGLSSSAQAINESGQIAGFFEPDRGRTHAFLFDAGGLRDLDTMNNVYSAAYGVNARGDTVGVLFNSPSDDDQAFVWTGGAMYNLNDLLDTREDWNLVEAWDINDAGQIVGYGIKAGRERAFLLTPLENGGGALPRVRWTAPAQVADFVEPADIELAADVESARAVRRVTFHANGDVVGVATDAPFRMVWRSAPAGDYDFVARAYDARGQMGVSPRVRIAVRLREPAEPEPAAPARPASAPTDERPAGADAP